ncbi:phosphate ABC transporter permease PstA [Phragmitibacter flavus]|uniref:Phosphate transport system permease protein PstA n=1 Tax=Phragmitibacter flavus TaxID=2576071 RepID=A0A5R8KEF8_9BACT|nr:phosphate ABC transporter permease PstA [Phragmitibacter flavus]TLD70698.1 phosphate ABC transporter permease PstA [Phragmitibacter flavus]
MHDIAKPKFGVPGARVSNSQLGETNVWLSALGLTTGIIMVISLMLLILIQGLVVFWPREVLQFTTTANGKAEVIAGEVRKTQERRDPTKPGEIVQEYLFFTGNKDAYGNGFRYLDVNSISNQTKPSGIYMAERLEYGDSIFFPVSLKLVDGRVISATDPTFQTEFKRVVKEVNNRRGEIKKVEKGKIGKINNKLSSLALDEKVLTQGNDSNKQQKLAEITEKRAALQADYEVLAKEAQALRARQHENTLVYKLADNTERTQHIGEIVHYYMPNDLSFLGKVSHFIQGLWNFIVDEPREANTEGGIFPAIFGTFVMTILMSVLVTPLGVIAAIYLREYAKQGLLVQSVRISVNNLAGVPSIVFGVFGLGFFVYFVGASVDQLFFSSALPTPTFGTGGVLWASFTLALLTLPVVIVATEEALVAVPRGVREAGLACGASKWQMIQRVVLPSALPGILTGVILAMARGAGEVAPLMLVGVVKLAPSLPLDLTAPFIHAERKFMHLGFHIYDLGFQSPDSEAAKPMVFATTMLLILLVVIMNVAAIRIRNNLRKKYAASTF